LVCGKTVFITVFLLANLSLFACAFPAIPETYSGIVYIDGEPASAGVEIKVVAENGAEFTTTVVNNQGVYALDILLDDPETVNIQEGAPTGGALTWYVNTVVARQPASGQDAAESGELNDNFNVLVGSGGPSCSDGIRNQGETGVDCGGPCGSCGGTPTSTANPTSTLRPSSTVAAGVQATTISPQDGTTDEANVSSTQATASSAEPTPPSTSPAACSDGVRNSGEEGIDCGGPCDPCGGSSSNTLLLIGLGGILIMSFIFLVLLAALLIFLKSRKKEGKIDKKERESD